PRRTCSRSSCVRRAIRPTRTGSLSAVLRSSPADVRIILDRLTKRFGASTAVDGLSLEIGQGELVSLVGGSGCGKTTTLRVIAGFERPDAGEIRFDGRVVNDVPPRKRGVGIVFQSYALFPTMTAR